MSDIEEQLSSMRDDEITDAIAAFRIIKDRATRLEEEYKTELANRLEDGGTRTATLNGSPVATISKTRSTIGKGLTVKDRLAYAQWLVDTMGDDAPVYPVPYPKDTAMQPSYLKQLGEQHGVELDAKNNVTNIPGLKYDAGREATVRTSLDRRAVEAIWASTQLPAQARYLLDNGGEL
ncbi:hypothetical protein [Bifidobacterium tissieri]|uniref:Uncharacterized protein n=1 Tax=Bifidobacterium tissieri TaxID=1630162 RepID=A0A5M9ZMY3_9BIFI|nr:hypothetical protein [Bifidobacterium tissieri]KAA8828653.1 hypothetical protein EM849_11490 [Bifidobacterium tissieri]KAA8831596.1 hypothetical protein EMO89_02405 [Bifidobacterium tissieri]